MSRDYLWDKSGEPDPEIVRLERELSRYRYRAPDEEVSTRASNRAWKRTLWIGVAAAAALALAWIVLPFGERAGDGYRVADGYRVVGIEGRTLARAGDALATSAGARARVEIAGLGEVDVQPRTRLRIEDCGVSAHKLFLERGTVHARIWASPRQFQIDTPAGLSIDLGCEYTLDVDESGRSLLRVQSGQVAFERDGRSVYVPAGATCVALPGSGPAIPVFEDASEEFKSALLALDSNPRCDTPGAADPLFDARREDTLTLWHIFDAPSTEAALRLRCYQRLSKVFPKPLDATEEGLLAGNRAMRDAWMDVMKPSWRTE